jgi:hypothetical protein
MMFIDVGTQKTALGKAEVLNKNFRYKNGETLYDVKWTGPHEEKFEFQVRHDRRRGAWGLAEKVCRKARKEMEKFYSYPEDKVTPEGLIRSSDIPERYKKDFGEWLGIATVSLLPCEPCPEGCLQVDEVKSETAYNLSDLVGFLESRLYGASRIWD